MISVLIGLLCGGLGWAQEKKAEETTPPKITKVVLYKHGMGYFERHGTVKGDATITLNFKTDQVKDLLTSLFAIDENGGKIATIGYDSKDPIDKQLANILFRVPEGAALTQFLTQLKGAKVEVKIGSETVRGQILGIEPVPEKVEGGVITAYKFVLLREDGTIRPFDLLGVESLKLLDDPIQKDLKRMLDIYLAAKYTDRKTVQLKTTGKGERDIRIGYLIETPIWKTSYRLIMEAKQKPFLQGWAIVENPTDEDWDDVEMSFVAGNPISFVLDLYTSYYPRRPTINLGSLIPLVSSLFEAEELAVDKQLARSQPYYEEAKKLSEDAEIVGRAKDKRSRETLDKGGLRNAPGQPALKPQKSMAELLSSSISAIASGAALGELFAYEAKTPVTIQRNKAAMVPIVTEPVEGNKVLYYRREISPYPTNALYLTNSTKLTLEAGPVTLFEGSTSVGEGLLKQTLQPGMKEILPYAIETACSMEVTGRDAPKPVHKAKLSNGVLVLTNYTILETTYKCINKGTKNYVFYLDHPKAGGYTLIEPTKPEEEIAGYYRFTTELAAGKTMEFKVREQRETQSQIYVQNMSMDQIKFYLGQSYLTKQVKEFLGKVSEVMAQIAEQDRIQRESQQEYQRLADDQNRFRQNMMTLNVNNPREQEVRAKYVAKLEKVEDQIGTLRSRMLEARDKKAELEQQLVKMIQEFKED
jgi:hypothetical protein